MRSNTFHQRTIVIAAAMVPTYLSSIAIVRQFHRAESYSALVKVFSHEDSIRNKGKIQEGAISLLGFFPS